MNFTTKFTWYNSFSIVPNIINNMRILKAIIRSSSGLIAFRFGTFLVSFLPFTTSIKQNKGENHYYYYYLNFRTFYSLIILYCMNFYSKYLIIIIIIIKDIDLDIETAAARII